MNTKENHISEENNLITSSVVTLPEAGDKIQSTETATVSSIAKAGAMAIMIACTSLATTSCDTKGEVDPIEKVDPNILTEKQKEWAKAIEPNADGTPKVVTLPPVGNEPFVYKDFMKMELKPLNYANGTYEFTPIFSKKAIKDNLAKAKELEPGKSIYGLTLAIPKNQTGSLTGSITIVDKDEGEGVSSVSLDELPEYFDLDDVKKQLPNYSILQKSYIISKNDNLELWLTTLTVGVDFDVVKKNINPLTLASSGGQ